MQSTSGAVAQPIAFLQAIIAAGGPETAEYDTLNQAFDALSYHYKTGKLKEEDVRVLQAGFGDECLQNTLHGHIKSKPFGYAGDFLIIDKIYREQVTEDDRFAKWDIFWNNHSAAKAVRNRKDYFIRTMITGINSRGPMRLLNVASGPARDLAELYRIINPAQLSTVCIEADKTAIDYAKTVNNGHRGEVDFIHQNIFRFRTEEKFDVVWSAGLFDYFDDGVFTKLLRRFLGWTASGGEVIIGNFSTQNPSRAYMEMVGDWFLHHRSEAELIAMAVAAGAPRDNVRVGKEMEGVNLFLHITV